MSLDPSAISPPAVDGFPAPLTFDIIRPDHHLPMPRPTRRSRPSPPPPPHVALLVETSIGPGRDIIRGVARYARESGPWALHLDARPDICTEGWTPHWLGTWQGGAGILARVTTDSVAAALGRLRLPTVDVFGLHPGAAFPAVTPDDRAIGRLAAQHLLDRGFRHFAFVAWPSERWSTLRHEGFCEVLAQHNLPCSVLESPALPALPEAWDDFTRLATDFIRRHPRPLGLMLCFDQLGPPVTQACRAARIHVPEDVAIIGVDNDGPLCEVCDPPLTSVDPNHTEVGYQAAALLDRLLKGHSAPKHPTLIPPKGVVTRPSTDVAAIDDPVLSAALSAIRQQACNGLQVADLAATLPVSRSVLQRRFQAAFGHSIHDAILKVQLARACELLRSSDLPIRDIATKAGFTHPEYMSAVFKSHLAQTPNQYRRTQSTTPITPAKPRRATT